MTMLMMTMMMMMVLPRLVVVHLIAPGLRGIASGHAEAAAARQSAVCDSAVRRRCMLVSTPLQQASMWAIC